MYAARNVTFIARCRKIVTVPAAAVGDDIGGVACYHAWCFVCACQRKFSEGSAAVFVKSDIGITHVQVCVHCFLLYLSIVPMRRAVCSST